jgi:hypothetical protein
MELFKLQKDLLILKYLFKKLILIINRFINKDILIFLLNLISEKGDIKVIEIINKLLINKKINNIFLKNKIRFTLIKI